MSLPLYRDPNYNRPEADAPMFERWRVRSTFGMAGYRCPACLQRWTHWRGLARHMAILHHKCRFCPKAYILVDQHEKRTHTLEYAVEAGACVLHPARWSRRAARLGRKDRTSGRIAHGYRGGRS